MSDRTKLVKQIEVFRTRLIKIKEGKGFSDPVVVTASRMLDKVLDKYQELM